MEHPTIASDREPTAPPLLAGVALLSAAVLAFEIALTRVFSVMLSYHYVFLVLSLAMLGLGLGALLRRRWQTWERHPALAHSAALAALAMAGSAWVIVGLPVGESAGWIDLRLTVYIGAALLPFVFAGAALAEVFSRHARNASALYGADLLGAAVGALGAVGLLGMAGGAAAAIAAAGLAAVAALCFARARGRASRLARTVTALVGAALLLALTSQHVATVPIAMAEGKDLRRLLTSPIDSAEIVESRWSAFGRTDLVRNDAMPEQMALFVDGAAGSTMFNFDSVFARPERQALLKNNLGQYFPFFFLDEEQKDTALIIGSGGGRDVILALLGGVRSITAVEVNPDVVAIVREQAAFNGGLYDGYPGVEVVQQEGRSFLRRSHGRYDLIMMALPVTKSSRSVEAYALTENYLFTIEALEDYLDHLTREGRLVITAHNPTELYRLVTTALTAFERRGMPPEEAMRHLYTVDPGMMPTLVVARQPVDTVATQVRHRKLHELGYDRGSYFVPGQDQQLLRLASRDAAADTSALWWMFDPVFVELAEGRLATTDLIASVVPDVRPVPDDRPFFFDFERGLPPPFRFFAALLLGGGILLLVLLTHRPRPRSLTTPSWPRRTFLLVFVLTGTGYLLVEVALFQKLTFYLGQPVYTVTVLLTTLLAGGGLGSFVSVRLRRNLLAWLAAAATVAAGLVLLYSQSLPLLFGLPVPTAVTAALVLLPLGIAMGIPFPLALRLMDERDLSDHVDGMWAANGIASVGGSVLAMITGMTLGFSWALALGAAVYAAIALLMVALRSFRSRGHRTR